MTRPRSVPRVVGAMVIAMFALLAIYCNAKETPEGDKVLEGEVPPPTEGLIFEFLQGPQFPAVVNLIINGPQIRVTPPYVQICRSATLCSENEFEWRIPGGLQEGERLVIRGARADCFGWPDGNLVIEPPNTGARSGSPLEACQADDKFGYFWPYIVELYSGDELIAATDPGGIWR